MTAQTQTAAAIVLTAEQTESLKSIDLANAKISDLATLFNGITGATLKSFKNRPDAIAHLQPLIDAATGTLTAATDSIDVAAAGEAANTPAGMQKIDGRGLNNRGKKYEKNPVERQDQSVRSFLPEGADRSEIFTHSQLAALTDCSWASSVTLVSALRCDYGMLIKRVVKVPVVREGVPMDKQPPAHMKEENGFIFFNKGEQDYNAYLEVESAKKLAAKAAADKIKNDAKAADKATRDAAKAQEKAVADAATAAAKAAAAKKLAEDADAAAKALTTAAADTPADPAAPTSDATPAADA